MKTVPRITVDDVNLIRILVCHLIYSLGCPLTKSQLVEITSLEQAVNYFDLISALDEIGEKLCTVEEIDGEVTYANTKLGDRAAREFSSGLPQSIREKMFEEAVKVYTRDAIKKSNAANAVAVRYAENQNGTCTLGISVKSQETGKPKYYLNVYADTKEQAERIKTKIKDNPEGLRDYLNRYFE